jgi:hypothetical protein
MIRPGYALIAVTAPAAAAIAVGLTLGGSTGAAIALGGAAALPLLLLAGMLTFLPSGPLWVSAIVGAMGSFLVRIGGAGAIAIAMHGRASGNVVLMSVCACLFASLMIEMSLWLFALRAPLRTTPSQEPVRG